MRCTTGSDMARLRAPAPFAGRGAVGFAAAGAAPLTSLNFSGLPVALLSAVLITRFGSGPSATSISTCEMATLTETSNPRTDHSPSSRLCASISFPDSSSAVNTALRTRSGEISPSGCGASEGGTSATAVAVPTSIVADLVDKSAGASPAGGPGFVKLGCAAAFGPLLRLRSASNGEGLPNGETGEGVVAVPASL